MEIDEELYEMQQMELAFKKACELHLQYEQHMISNRIQFQQKCPHLELKVSDYEDPIHQKRYNVYHCKRCEKLIKKEEKMSKIWFMSDTHYGHLNICYGTSNWNDKETTTRRYNTIDIMNDSIVKSINDCVMSDDIIYFLGDWSMGGIENIAKFIRRLNCKNIFFVPGNHDHHIKKNKAFMFVEDGNTIIVNPQEYFTMLPELTTITINKQKFVLSHYPVEQWEDMDRGSIMLHGHCHHTIDNCETNTKYRRMDIGIDWKEFRPYSLEEILKIMETREYKKHTS